MKKTPDQTAKEFGDKDYHHEKVLSGKVGSGKYNVAISGKKDGERYSKSMVKGGNKIQRTVTSSRKTKDGTSDYKSYTSQKKTKGGHKIQGSSTHKRKRKVGILESKGYY
jgi:hypothetical protein